MKVSDHYQGKRGEHYTALKQNDPRGHGYAIGFSYFRPYLHESGTMLDFGCGNGGILRLAATVVATADGLDVNPASAEFAKNNGMNIFSSLDELPNSPTYDIIISY